MFYLVKYHKRGTVHFAESTSDPNRFIILQSLTPEIPSGPIVPGYVVHKGTKSNIKEFIPIKLEDMT